MLDIDVRELEHVSVAAFVRRCGDRGLLGGRVLDLGCGLQPYRGIVESAGGEYHGYDRADLPAATVWEDVGDHGLTEGGWDTILCTQVIQYVADPLPWLREIRWALRRGGALVLTGPTNWPEVETADLHRLTLAGAERILKTAGFRVETSERRAQITVARNWKVSLGYGIVGRA
jgi:SAM-dependent methyltransferase